MIFMKKWDAKGHSGSMTFPRLQRNVTVSNIIHISRLILESDYFRRLMTNKCAKKLPTSNSKLRYI